MKKRLVCLLLALVMLVGLVPAGIVPAFATPDTLSVSAAGIKLIKEYVGFEDTAYEAREGVWKIGYGTPSKEGSVITEVNASKLLKDELDKLSAQVNGLGQNLVQKQHDALVWFAYANGGASNALLTNIINAAKVSTSDLANAIATFDLKAIDDVETAEWKMERRFPMANLYANGVYSADNIGTFAYALFDATEGYFNTASNKKGYTVQAFDTRQVNKITAGAPNAPADNTFLGWYVDDVLITGLDSNTAFETLSAGWQYKDQAIDVNYELPGSLIYESQGLTSGDDNNVNNLVAVYKKPSLSSERIDVVQRNENVTVIAEKMVGTTKWLQLEGLGWTWLGATVPEVATNLKVTVTDDYINIREKAEVTAKKLGVAKRGDVLTIIMTVKDSVGRTWGYCSKGWVCLMYTDYSTKTIVSSASTSSSGVAVSGIVVNAEKVNVRKAAGVRNDLVITVAQGTKVTVYEKTTVDGALWGRIDQGWISLQYVQMDEVQSSAAASSSSEGTVSSTVNLVVRSGPGSEYSKVATLTPGTAVTILQRQTVQGVIWGKVAQGWINLNYVSVKADSSNGIPGTVVNCSTAVNVRSDAGTTNALVGTVALGSRVAVTARKQVNGHYWGQIATGWVCMDYVQLDREWVDPTPNTSTSTAPETPAAVFKGYPGKMAADGKLYAEASSDAKVLLTINTGAAVNIQALKMVGENKFGKVTIGSTTGWVNMDNVTMDTLNVYVTAAKANTYEEHSTRSTFYAAMTKGTTLEVSEQFFDGTILWGKITDGSHTAWINLADVTMYIDNAAPFAKFVMNGVGYLTGKVTAEVEVYKDDNGNKTTDLTDYKLAVNHRVNVLARAFDGTDTWAKITVGSTTGWIDMSKVKLDPVEMKVTAASLDVFDGIEGALAKTLDKDDRITITDRTLHAYSLNTDVINDWGTIYVNDDKNTTYYVTLDEGKLAYSSKAPAVPEDTSTVLTIVPVTGKATAALSVYAEVDATSTKLIEIANGSFVTVMNWKNAGGKTWGKVQVGSIVGWIDTSMLDFTGLKATVAVDQLKVFAKVDVDSAVEILRINGRAIDITKMEYDGAILWGKIAVSGKDGWINLADVTLNKLGATTSNRSGIATATINSVDANVTLKKDDLATDGELTVPKNTKVSLLAVKLDSGKAYWKVDMGDESKDGYIDMNSLTMDNVTARVTASKTLVLEDLKAGAADIATLYENEKITIKQFKMNAVDNNLYGEVDAKDTTGWILVADASGLQVALTPGATASNPTVTPTAPTTPAATTAPVASDPIPATIVCSSEVRVRNGAGVGFTQIGTLRNGTAVKIYEQKAADNGVAWARVDQGWVCMDYVSIGNGTGAGAGTGSTGSVTILTTVPAGAIAVGYANEDVKIRQGAGLGYPEVATLKKGNGIVIYEKKLDGGMSWGRTDNGWVCISYLTITGIGVPGSGSMGTIARCGFTTNVRNSAGINGALMAKVMVSSRIAYYETTVVSGETWARTDLGWVSMNYVAADAEAAPIVPETTPSATEIG